MTQWRDLGKPKRRVRLKTRIKRRVRKRPLFHCGSCGKQYSNPLGHTCTGGGGLKQKRAAAERSARAEVKRRREADARTLRREREEAARKRRRTREDEQRRTRREREERAAAERRAKAASKKARPRRPGRPQHDYARCRDHDCERVACEAWREAWADAREQFYQPRYDEGFAAGVRAAEAQ